MRIINGFDYYDAANIYSDQPVYIRRNYVSKTPEVFPENPYMSAPLENRMVYVIFCGTMYGGIQSLDHSEEVAWDFDTYNKHLQQNILHAKKTFEPHPYPSDLYYDEKRAKKYFDPINCRDFCIQHKITIAIRQFHRHTRNSAQWILEPYGRRGDIYNLCLKTVNFYRVIPTQQACQAIEMWVGGVLTNNPDPPQIVDERIRIAKRGFDPKTSFRKESQKGR